MWKLESVHAKNLCAFKELDYKLLQNCTTLVFGNNMDNDSQGSNGSGKSALLEAIAIGLTGEPLRKIKMEEIINDAENEADVSICLVNQLDSQIVVNRRISRKKPQSIQVFIQHRNESQEEVVKATVSDYNEYILETIGLTKDDLYSTFILSKNKYVSFLSCSDREKKEVINRFSNGNLVDDSISALQADIEPILEELNEVTTEVAVANGRVETLNQQIDLALQESTERSQKKAERIAGWKQAIVDKRAYIREQNEEQTSAMKLYYKYEDCDDALCKLEESNKSMAECYNEICEQFQSLGIKIPSDYTKQTAEKQNQLKVLREELQDVCDQNDKAKEALARAEIAYNKVKESYKEFCDSYEPKSNEIQNQIDKLLESVKSLENKNCSLNDKRSKLVRGIANIEKQLAGVITCPKCKHEFTLANDVDILVARQTMLDYQQEANDIDKSIAKNKQKIDDYIVDGKKVREEQNKLTNNKAEWSNKLSEAQVAVNEANQFLSELSNKSTELERDIASLINAISDARTTLFDETYDYLNEAIDVICSKVKSIKLNISNAEGAILSYEESIEEANKTSDNDIISNLKSSLVKSQEDLHKAMIKQTETQDKLNTYKVQEATFVEFKTYLANTKINALSYITNQFLEKIGSDIQICLSGYTVLKSGKVRDKISISLLRDGIDCGSFDKFSAGERARVELATILAMNHLTNSSCDDGKGLDLLVLDEILEAVDEQGLNNIFNALNNLQITSLVVSHGNIAEGYPYKTIVNKLNGVSYLDDKQ